jgi:hypothetical protein
MNLTNYALSQILFPNFSLSSLKLTTKPENSQPQNQFFLPKINFLLTIKNWLNNIEVNNSLLAHRICKLIPTQCPFQRKVKIFGYTILNIPPLCKLNPVYDELMFLRFRAISFLADRCGEDVSNYC